MPCRLVLFLHYPVCFFVMHKNQHAADLRAIYWKKILGCAWQVFSIDDIVLYGAATPLASVQIAEELSVVLLSVYQGQWILLGLSNIPAYHNVLTHCDPLAYQKCDTATWVQQSLACYLPCWSLLLHSGPQHGFVTGLPRHPRHRQT
jgi:hypothetical protein